MVQARCGWFRQGENGSGKVRMRISLSMISVKVGIVQ